MKVLMFSTDKNILNEGSATSWRMLEYASLFDELHIVVLSSKDRQSTINKKQQKLSAGTFVYSTNSVTKFSCGLDAIKIGKKIAKTKKNDWVITSQDPFETGLVAWVVARAKRAPLQLQVHCDFLSPHFAKNLKNKIRIKIAKFLLPRADAIRVVSERIKQSLHSTFHIPHSKVSVLPIYVDIQHIINTKPKFNIHEKYPQFEFIILMLGRLEKEKNYHLAISVLKSVVQKYQNTGLVIVGDGKEREEIENFIKKCNLQNNVILEGFSEDVVSYCKTSDLFLHTSNYEGFGLALVEAAASACPIVSTDVGVIGSFLNKNNTLLCAVGDADCIYKSIILAMENKPLRLKMSIDAQKSASGKIITKKEYLKLYKEALLDCKKTSL